MKEKYLNATQVAKIMGMQAYNIKDFLETLTNHSPSNRYRFFEETEVLAKKEQWLADKEKRKAEVKQKRAEHCKRIQHLANKSPLNGRRKDRRGNLINTVNNDDLKERLRLLKEIAELEKKI